MSWPIRPLRAIGPRAWIIGTAVDPPPGTLCFNSSPVLARQIPPRHAQKANPIIAGPKPMQAKSQGKGSNPAQGAPPLKFDPWANYSGARPAPATPSNPGPTDLKFEAQEQRIEKLETSLKELQDAQDESKHHLTDLKTEVQKRDEATRNHFDSQLHQMQQQLNQSFLRHCIHKPRILIKACKSSRPCSCNRSANSLRNRMITWRVDSMFGFLFHMCYC